MSFSNKASNLKDEKSRNNDKKFNRQDDRVDIKKFDNMGDVGHLQDRKANVPADAAAQRMQDNTYRNADKNYMMPENKFEAFEWNKADRTPHLSGRADYVLNKEYAGRMDVTKTVEMDDKLKRYAELVDPLSINDLNRFWYRESRKDKEGIDVIKAGEELLPPSDEKSFLDILSSNKTVDRPVMSFKKPHNVGMTAFGSDLPSESAQAKPKQQNNGQQTLGRPFTAPEMNDFRNSTHSILPSGTMQQSINMDAQRMQRIQQDNQPNVQIKEVELKKGFLIPKELSSGKAIIKVEVK